MDRKYQIDTPENRSFLKDSAEGLLSFGHRFPSPRGSSYYLGDDGTPWTDRPRETWITARMTHVYSLGEMLGHEGSHDLVEAGLSGLLGELKDTKNGGWYPGVTAEGKPLPDKQCYAHAFVILAASSAMLAGHERAKALYEDATSTFLTRFWDKERGLTYDTWNTEFTRLDPYRGINANMHTVEAFLAAADATGDETFRRRAGRITDHVILFAENNNWRIPEHYTADWVPDLDCNKDHPDDQFKPYGATPGHGIEWARLITQYALSTYDTDEERAPYLDAAKALYRRAVTDGWNADGAPGIVYTTDWDGTPVVHDRMHWTLAEAINTSSSLYHVTGDEAYAKDYADFMQYLDSTVMDHVNGSWFHQLDAAGHPLTTVWPGKSDLYHALQSMLIPTYDPKVSIARAVRDQKLL